MAKPTDIALADVLEGLREDLAAAAIAGAAKEVHFPIESVTIELKVGVTSTDGVKAGFRVPLIGSELGGSAEFGRESTQTLTLVLGPPVDSGGAQIKVGAETTEERAN